MTTTSLSLDRGGINPRRVFLYLFLLAAIALFLLTTGNTRYLIGFGVVLVAPVIVLLLPAQPLIGLVLMFIATGFDSAGRVGAAHEAFSFTYFHVAMAITFLATLMHKLLTNQTRLPSITLWPPALSFVIMMAFSLLYTARFMVGFMEVVRMIVLLLLAYAMVISIDTERQVKFAVWSYILIPALVSGYTIYEMLTEGSFFATSVVRMARELGMPVFRSTGTFGNPNSLACFLMVGIAIGFGLFMIRNLHWPLKLLLLTLIFASTVGLIASFSRGGWLSTMATVFLIVLFHRRWKYFYIFPCILAIVLIVMSIKFPHIVVSAFGRFSTILQPLSEDSSSSRIALIKTAIWMWQDHPLFGVGAASHAYYAPQYTDPSMPQILLHVVEPHTIQAKILAEEGLVGFVIATWFFFTVIFDGFKSLKTMASDYLRHIQIAFIALFIGFIVNFTFGADMFNNTFWISIGVMYAIPIADANEQARKRARLAAGGADAALPVPAG